MSCSGKCVIISQVAQLDSLCTLIEREMNNCNGFHDKIFYTDALSAAVPKFLW